MHDDIVAPADSDDDTDLEIAACLDLDNPQSFFLYAGAGSGKTRSLVNSIKHVLTNYARALELRGQSLAVITYTNAAANEISERLDFSTLVHVSTIHSFAWTLIRDFQHDIRETLRTRLSNKLDALNTKSSRPGTKAEATRVHDIERTNRRLGSLDSISQFTYSPTGDSRSRESLDHAEVISLTEVMLNKHHRLADVLTARHPYLFIDESQDTNGNLLDAFLSVQNARPSSFCLGLFGDTMQRVYNDGKANLAEALGEDWLRPAKKMNHRSKPRIVKLANSIREDVDSHRQFARPNHDPGLVRLFLADSSMSAKEVESYVTERMSELSQDKLWLQPYDNAMGTKRGVKKLILEHHMAAHRIGFSDLLNALLDLQSDRTAILEGRHPEVLMFTHELVPLVQAARRGDTYGIMSILRERSPLFTPQKINENSLNGHTTKALLSRINTVVERLSEEWANGKVPTLFAVAVLVHEAGLFDLPDQVTRALAFLNQQGESITDESQPWVQILQCSFTELENYTLYTSAQTDFATHQGVKGLEFPRVMVILKDEESRGFMFSYDKLFGAKALTDSDLRNEKLGKETSVERTRRLFYVTCTRAEDSLAVVAYTQDPASVQQLMPDRGWFRNEEIEYVTPEDIERSALQRTE